MHVIVGQGQLDAVLHAEPEDRRAFIEEAAGVLKHRKRKEKALRKLEAMAANLTRVTDLTAELRRQLKPLGRQAEVARRAAGIQADLRDARLRLLADDLLTLRRHARDTEVADETALRAAPASRRAGAGRSHAREAVWRRRSTQPAAAAGERPADLVPALRPGGAVPRDRCGLAERAGAAPAAAEAGEERPGRDPEELERRGRADPRPRRTRCTEALEPAQAALADAVDARGELERALAAAERQLDGGGPGRSPTAARVWPG